MLVPVELSVDIFGHLWERVGSMLSPEEILRVEVVGPLLRLSNDHTVQFHLETI